MENKVKVLQFVMTKIVIFRYDTYMTVNAPTLCPTMLLSTSCSSPVGYVYADDTGFQQLSILVSA